MISDLTGKTTKPAGFLELNPSFFTARAGGERFLVSMSNKFDTFNS